MDRRPSHSNARVICRAEQLNLPALSTGHTCQPFAQKYCYCDFSEIVIYSPHPVPQRGRFAIVTDVGCGMRWAHGIAARVSRADERFRCDGEVAWFWHPGADAKSADDKSPATGAIKPVPGEIAYKS